MERRQTADQINAIFQAGIHEDQCNCAGYDALTMDGCLYGFRATASISVEAVLDIVAEMIDRHHQTDELAHEGFDGDGYIWFGETGTDGQFGSIPEWLRR